MSKDGPKPGESTVSPVDLTDNKREISNPNDLHLEKLCIAENSDQPSSREGEPKLKTQESRNVNGHNENKDRDKGSATPQRQRGNFGNYQRKPRKLCFEAYISEADLKKGLDSGQLIEGPFRINPKNYEEAYIPHPDGESDIFICGMKDRNRALNGDIVAVVLDDRDNWKIHVNNLKELKKKYQEVESSDNTNDDNQSEVTPRKEHQGELDSVSQPESKIVQKNYLTFQEVMKGSDVVKNLFTTDNKEKSLSANRVLQRTGKVVALIQPKHSRVCRGSLHLMNNTNQHTALFRPRDSRLPRIMIPKENFPKDFLKRPEDHANTMFISRINEWRDNSIYAHGELMGKLGERGEVYAETEGILIENDVDESEFTEEMLGSLPMPTWQIPDSEITKRRDFRQQCVFTIDPATAKDLDDALSCEKLEDGTYNVGVHIADVSYFLKDDSALDRRASRMATSVYLVQEVIPMLPTILSEELCSLNPNQDRLTFSVIWNLSEKGEINREWFGRTVIRSCVKLSYDHAQGFIEEPEREWTEEELPTISDGYSISQIKETVLNLHKITKNLRKVRFDKGALYLDQVKLQFSLDEDTGMPNGYSVYKQKDSNRLVEELMLLANIAVADKIKKHFPDKALLRRHPKPQSKMVDELVEWSTNVGFPIDATSAGTIQKSLWRYAESDDIYEARMQVLVNMCCKVMQKAKYFCTGCIDDEELYRHYALNVPVYTHFTSPIRRYADVMVHRTLAAALDNCELSEKSTVAIQSIAENCNDRKTNAKQVSDLSSELFFGVFVNSKTTGPFEEKGMVMGVLDKAFDVVLLNVGVKKRVYCNQLDIKNTLYKKERNNPVLTLYWKPTEENDTGAIQKISIFTKVTCILKPGESPLEWTAIIKAPEA